MDKKPMTPEAMEAAAIKQITGRPKSLVRHPRRYSIDGDTHTLEEIKKLVAGEEKVSIHLKHFLTEEIGKLSSNAAEIHLHVIDHANGGVSGNFHIVPRVLGKKKAHKVD